MSSDPAHAPRPAPPQPYRMRYGALAVLCLSLLLIALDNTIMNVALPTLVRELDASASQLQWIVDAYVLVFAGLLLTAGSLGDRFGRKGALNLGLLIFAGGALAATRAHDANQLIAMRAVMGVGGAFIMPSTLSLLTNVFPDDGERARAIAIWAGVVGLGIAIGPVTGGWLLERFWWGSVFFVNLPVAAVALVAGQFLVPTSRDPAAPRIDLGGAALSMAALGASLYAIIEAPGRGWTSGPTLAWFAVAAVALLAFAWWERRTAAPMLDLAIFRNARFSAASAAMTLVFFAMFGSIFLLTQHLQFVLGFSALGAGIRVLPLAVTIAVTAPVSARVVERVGTKAVVATGLVLVALGLAWIAQLAPADGYGALLPRLVLLAAGMGMTMAPATDAIMGAFPAAKAGVGSAMNDATRQVGGALGVAVLGSVLSSRYGDAMSAHLAGLPAPAADAARDSVGAAMQVAHAAGGAPGAALALAARVAFVDAMGVAVLVAAGVALSGAAVAALFLPARASAAGPAPAPVSGGAGAHTEAAGATFARGAGRDGRARR